MKKEKHYRIVTDRFAGFEVQEERKFLWFKWWIQLSEYDRRLTGVNTFSSIEEAVKWIKVKPAPAPKTNVVWDSEISQPY